jgi:SynChlorMet cassette protein ScmD
MEHKPIVNPLIVLREEFDDWAILFDPDTGDGFGLNPVSVFVWRQLDGRHTVGDIIARLRDACDVLPEEVEEHVQAFIATLVEKGLVGSVSN